MKAIEEFRAALEAGNQHQLGDILADDAVLRSPAVIESTYSGRDLVVTTLGLAFQLLENLRVVDELVGTTHSTHALVVEGRVERYRLQGCFYLKTDQADLITEVTFLLRPLHAVQALVSGMAAKGARPALDLQAGGE